MKLVRSFPRDVQHGRNYVVDDAEKLENADYDYRGLVHWDDDVLHLDWDMAIGRDDLVAFADYARADPGQLLVAPYQIYPDSRAGLTDALWAAKRYEDDETGMRYVREDDPTCHLFGFGMVYLPRDLIRGFCDAFPDPAQTLNDIAFSGWHYRNITREVPLTWDIRPVHVHYKIRDVVS